MVRGSCLCGTIQFEIDGRMSEVGHCHCSVCRKASGTGSTTALLTATRSFRWVSGEDAIRSWKRESGWTHAFCTTCGSPAPHPHENGKIVHIPAGILDDDPGVAVHHHIFVGSKAAWEEIPKDAPHHDEWAPED